jgi:hypothetical protein
MTAAKADLYHYFNVRMVDGQREVFTPRSDESYPTPLNKRRNERAIMFNSWMNVVDFWSHSLCADKRDAIYGVLALVDPLYSHRTRLFERSEGRFVRCFVQSSPECAFRCL